jgi:hypothetical protein
MIVSYTSTLLVTCTSVPCANANFFRHRITQPTIGLGNNMTGYACLDTGIGHGLCVSIGCYTLH